MIPSQFGIDGCKAGWLAIWIDKNNFLFDVCPNLFDLSAKYPTAKRYLIDIPIGLGTPSHPRSIETVMRQELKGRASTVFNSPSRAAAYCESYQTAKAMNLSDTGKSLSQQSFAISPKIREANDFTFSETSIEVIESHPEIAFKHLNAGKVLMSKKKTTNGLLDRLQILTRVNSNVERIYSKIESKTPRKSVARDDIVDALCLACTLEVAGESLQFLTDENKFDSQNTPIRIGIV